MTGPSYMLYICKQHNKFTLYFRYYRLSYIFVTCLLFTGSLIDPSYNSATAPESPSSSASLPDVDSSFAGPFDPEQLPLEIQNALYDPRMFANNEIYIDPDIIGKHIILCNTNVFTFLHC